MKQIKISVNGKLDMLKFRDLGKDRQICINETSSSRISEESNTNQLASLLHPSLFHVRVKEIIEENDHVKTFVLEQNPAYDSKIPKFRAGQYITLQINIEKGIYKRAYSISCSSKHLEQGEIQITIDKVPNGIVSSYFHESVNIGDEFIARGPYGDFTYQSLRDASHIIGIAGGSGVTPFVSLAEAICDGEISASLTLLYGAKTEKDLLFQDKFADFQDRCPNIKVMYLLSEEEREGYLHGFVTKELLVQVAKEENSYFVSGPIGLYESMNEILKEMDINNKYIRHDVYDTHQKGVIDKTFQVRVLTQNEEKTIPCNGCETLMSAMEREGILAPKKCGVGVCGFCLSKLIDGEVLTNSDSIRECDKDFYYIHPCVTYPISDLTIKLPF